MKNEYYVTVNQKIKATGAQNFYEVWDDKTNRIMQGQLTALEAYGYAKFLNSNGAK